MLELVAAEAPRECILGPYNLAADLKATSFQCVLKFALPGGGVADIELGTRLHDGPITAKRGFQELLEFGVRHSITLDGQAVFRIALIVYPRIIDAATTAPSNPAIIPFHFLRVFPVIYYSS